MKQLTLRGFSSELAQVLSETARRRGISLNKAAIHLLRRGAGLRYAGDGPDCIGSALDNYAGSWTEREARIVDNVVGELDMVEDKGFWK